MILHNYFRSSASYRVRIALNLKNLGYEYRAVHLKRDGGEQFKPEFRLLNPQSLVPVLELDGKLLTQSLSILEYLDEVYPVPPLLPKSPAARARVRALAECIACDVHPLNNLRVLKYLADQLKTTPEARTQWYRHWVKLCFDALEAELSSDSETGPYCHGDVPSIADCCLVPQLFNARRFDCDLSAYSTLLRIEQNCQRLPAFKNAAPELQPDNE